MFQNISKNIEDLEQTQNIEQTESKKNVLKRLLTKQNISLYIISFMISMATGGIESNFSPFSIAILAATLSNRCTRRNYVYYNINRNNT